MAKEDYLIQLSMLEQESRKFEEQIHIVRQQVLELESLKLSLENLNKSDEKEFLANLGKGIFVKSEIKDKELFVNVGEGVILKKNVKETEKIINEQIAQLEGIQKKLAENIDMINEQLQDLIVQAQKEG